MVNPWCSCRRHCSGKNWSLKLPWKKKKKNWEKWRTEWGHVFLISDHRLMNTSAIIIHLVANAFCILIRSIAYCDSTSQEKTHKRCFGLSESNVGQVSKFTFMSSTCTVSCTQNAQQHNNDRSVWARRQKKADRQINQNQKQKLLSDNWLFIWWTFGNDRKWNEPSPCTVVTDEGRWLLHSYVVIVLSVDR